ncbi:hypothetical protein FQN55_004381 [Onygenales sp. PD_40]|nr:hypothetical protein FQN55_004381 [Onygenales sp. PD_40]KAK2788965.1 hypothetical protein FQN53_002779 [Emmonsiellopsis sp. PD_33]
MATDQKPLAGKVAIVTGASKMNGIGAATAIALAKKGADILIHYASSADPAQQVLQTIKTLGVNAAAVQADASTADFGSILVTAALQELQTTHIDIIVNNAGKSAFSRSIAATPFDSWDPVFHVNVRGPFTLIQAALPHMPAGGRIINISSVVARQGAPLLPVYCASRGALNSLTVSLASELAAKGVTINIVAPGPVATDLSIMGTPIIDRLMANQHIKREGTAEEVAAAVEFLAMPGSGFITGQIVAVDGGIHLP